MQKIELTNEQYRLLLRLVSLGIDVIDNAALEEDEEEDNESGESALFNDAMELEEVLMSQYKKFDIKDMIWYDDEEECLQYSGSFVEEQQTITQSAYLNKAAEIASFQLGIRDYKKANGRDSLENITDPEEGVNKVMPFTMKYLNEIFENGFDKFYLSSGDAAKIISLSSE
jgi:hypothetical protein